MSRWIKSIEIGQHRNEHGNEATIVFTDGTIERRFVNAEEAYKLRAEAEADAAAFLRSANAGYALGKKIAETENNAMTNAGYSNSSEEFGSQEHSEVMDAILGRGNY